tara:strand:+ start:4411 stop:5004 length:594 start_codon:yes stop_codon:yes gene_type:complete
MVKVMARTNAKQWQSAMKAWTKATGKSRDDCINKFGAESCVKAIRHTPKARVGRINTYDPEKGGRTKKQKLLFALASNQGIRKGSGGEQIMYPYVRKEFNKRKKSIGALKAGFIRPAIQLGARLKTTPFGGGSASKSKGIKSKSFKMKAFAFNEVEGSGLVAYKAMDRAMIEAAAQEKAWAVRRLQKQNNKFSAKPF